MFIKQLDADASGNHFFSILFSTVWVFLRGLRGIGSGTLIRILVYFQYGNISPPSYLFCATDSPGSDLCSFLWTFSQFNIHSGHILEKKNARLLCRVILKIRCCLKTKPYHSSQLQGRNYNGLPCLIRGFLEDLFSQLHKPHKLFWRWFCGILRKFRLWKNWTMFVQCFLFKAVLLNDYWSGKESTMWRHLWSRPLLSGPSLVKCRSQSVAFSPLMGLSHRVQGQVTAAVNPRPQTEGLRIIFFVFYNNLISNAKLLFLLAGRKK